MTENQKLREALQIAESALADIGDADREPGDDLAWCERRAAQDLPTIRQALALPTADHIPDAGEMVADQVPDAGKMIETAPPAGERDRFEQFAQNHPMGKYNVTRRGEGYDSSHTQIMWAAWQARAALQSGADARDGGSE